MVTTPRGRHALLVGLEPILWVIGIVCLTWVAWTAAQQRAVQRAHEVAMSTSDLAAARHTTGLDSGTARPNEVKASDEPPRPGRGTAIGRLDVPRLGLSVMVAEGDDERTLKGAVGHLPDTPLPWEEGNSALAGHRDSFFRPLKAVKAGDAIVLTTPGGRIEYQVRRTAIVQPDELWVLDPAPQVDLTLITCYPFNYVGSAPQRYIVHAAKVDRTSGSRGRLARRSASDEAMFSTDAIARSRAAGDGQARLERQAAP